MENVIERKLPTIYFADSEQDNNVIAYFKDSDNFNFIGASLDGNKVVEDVKNLRPDILVMEVILQNLDGFAVFDKIKEL